MCVSNRSSAEAVDIVWQNKEFVTLSMTVTMVQMKIWAYVPVEQRVATSLSTGVDGIIPGVEMISTGYVLMPSERPEQVCNESKVKELSEKYRVMSYKLFTVGQVIFH